MNNKTNNSNQRKMCFNLQNMYELLARSGVWYTFSDKLLWFEYNREIIQNVQMITLKGSDFGSSVALESLII